MSDDLIKRLRDIGEEETGYGVRNEAADLIEQQAARIKAMEVDMAENDALIDELRAQVAALESAEKEGVPVAWALQEQLDKRESTWRGYLWFVDPKNTAWTPLFLRAAPASKDAIRREALEECWEAVHAEHLQDPTDSVDDIAYERAVTDCENAIRALSQKAGE
jgi:uncharacterized coiled-coil protein SlyX